MIFSPFPGKSNTLHSFFICCNLIVFFGLLLTNRISYSYSYKLGHTRQDLFRFRNNQRFGFFFLFFISTVRFFNFPVLFFAAGENTEERQTVHTDTYDNNNKFMFGVKMMKPGAIFVPGGPKKTPIDFDLSPVALASSYHPIISHD